ncbi:MAG: hypothetical protein SH819_07375 [Cytophagales bacterium]|nr:hypothetical protein [Cytophagales bacterium]
MKLLGLLTLLFAGTVAQSQSLVGTWQLVDEKTCFESQMEESETEKELRKDMGSSKSAVARLLRFDKNGTGEEGIFVTGKKKGSAMTAFRYRVNGRSIQLLDRKSGIMTQELIIDDLSATSLSVHLASKDCETKAFSRIK